MAKLSAYSRDPNMLFYMETDEACQQQPILLMKQNRYKNVTLKVDLSEFLTAGTPIYEAIVDWYNLNIRVFVDSDDSLNNVPCFEGTFKILCEPRPAETYVSETFQFLARGHSIHHPQCTCSLSLEHSSGGRAAELGLLFATSDHNCSQNYDNNNNNNNHHHHQKSTTTQKMDCSGSASYYYYQPCQLETKGCQKKIDEIARELGVVDLNGIVQVSERVKMPLIEALTHLAGMKLTEPGFLSSALCCVPSEIQSAQDILAAAKAMYPKPYLLDCRNTANCETQSLIQDLHILKQRYLVRAVAGPHPNTFSVFYFNTAKEKKLILQHMIDKYIKNLWHKEARESCSFFNGPSQREVERMLIEENIKPIQVQKQQKSADLQPKKKQKKNISSQSSINKMVGHLKHFSNGRLSSTTMQ